MACLSTVNTFSISSDCQSDVKTQPTDICENILFSIPYVNLILLMSTLFPFLQAMTNVCYNLDFRLGMAFPKFSKTEIFLTDVQIRRGK